MDAYTTGTDEEKAGNTKRFLGQLLEKSGFVSPVELETALATQNKTNALLGETLLQMGVLDPSDLKIILSLNKNVSTIEDALKLAAGVRSSLGELLLQARHITPLQLDIALREHERTGAKLGRVFVRHGLVTETELHTMLRFQKNQETGSGSHHCLRLGELLLSTGQITESQLLDSLEHQKGTGDKLGEILVVKGYIDKIQLSRGLTLQRRLLTVLLVALLSLVPVSAGHPTGASHDEDLAISGSLGTHTALKMVFQTSEVVLTMDDIARGYVDIPAAAQLEIRNSNLSGYLVIFNGLSKQFKEVHVEGLGQKVVVTSHGGEVARPYHGRDPLTLMLRYRIILDGTVKPGRYPCPLTISVSPIIPV